MFDPPHLGHLELAREAYSRIKPGKVIWVPAKFPPHRKVENLESGKRVEMLRWWFRDKPMFEVSDMEMKPGHSGYSVETVKKFAKMYPDEDSYFLVGSDEAVKFKSWKHWDRILRMTHLIVGRRGGDDRIPRELEKKALLLDNSIYSISSSEIRQMLKNDISVYGMLDESILQYIKDNRLYA